MQAPRLMNLANGLIDLDAQPRGHETGSDPQSNRAAIACHRAIIAMAYGNDVGQGHVVGSSNLWRFGGAHAARSLGWSFVDLLLAWHLHTRVGLTGSQTGWLLFAFLALGGMTTLLVGLGLSRRQADGNVVVRVQLPASFAVAVLLGAQFQCDSTPAVVAASLAFRVAYAVQDVTQNMLASLLPADDAAVRRYSRWRVTLSAVTRCVVVGGFGLVMPHGMTAMLAATALAIILSALSLRGLTFPPRPVPTDPARRSTLSMPQGLAGLLAGWAIAATLLPTLNRLLIFAPPIDGLSRSGAWLLGGFCVGSVAGPLFRGRVDRRLVPVMIAGSGLAMVLPVHPALGGWSCVAGAALHGVAVSIIGVQLWSATAQVAQDDARRGRANDGMVFGSVILTLHLASAAGMLVLGPLIEGFEAGRQDIALGALALTLIGALAIAAMRISERRASAAA